MTQPSKGVAAFLVFFGLMFFVPGLFFLFAAVFVKGSAPSGLVAGASGALLFVIIGGGLIFAAFYGYGRMKEQAAREESNPSSPWLWRTDWASRRAQSQNKNRAIGAWILCVLGNLFVLPFAIAMVPMLARQNDSRMIIVLAFCSLSPILFVYAVRASIRQRRYGDTYFEFYSLPFSPGGRLSGKIHLKFDASVQHGIDLRVSCVRKTTTGSGDSRSTVQTVLWQADQNIPPGAMGMDPLGQTIPVDFAIPSDAYVTDHDNPSDQVLWFLHASADVPGVNYTDDFEVPVFRTGSSTEQAFTSSSSSAASGFADSSSSDADSALVPAPTNTKVIISPQDGGTEFYFPAFRSPVRAILLFVFTAIWSGVVYFLLHSRAPMIFPIVFGLMDLLLVSTSFHVLFGTSRISVGNGEILSARKVLGIGRVKRFSISQIDAIMPVTSGQVGGNQGNPEYAIRLVTKEGRRYTLADEISSRQEARWIVSQIEMLAGLKIDTRVQVDSFYGSPPQPGQSVCGASQPFQPAFGSNASRPGAIQINWQRSRPASRTSTIISFAVFGLVALGMFAWQGWRFSTLKSMANSARSNSPRPARTAAKLLPARRVFASMTDADAERIQALPAQDQAEELLERAIGHDQRALDLFDKNVESWVGHINLTDRMKQLERRSVFSSDLRVRYANADINLTLDGWQKNEEAADMLIERARTDQSYRAAAVYFLGMLAGRGVAYEKIHPVLIEYAKHDPDATIRQWTVEGMRYLGKDEALDELFESFTHDPSMNVRDRAGCNVSDCGNFTRAQRMRMVPKLLDLVSDNRTNPQMRAWSFMALHEITDANVPADAQSWKNWYRDHGAEKLAEFQALDWWQVRGDE